MLRGLPQLGSTALTGLGDMDISIAQQEQWAARYTRDDRDTAMVAPCKSLEIIDVDAPFTQRDLQALGVSGIQFGSSDGRQAFCLNTDIAGLSCGDAETENARIYRVDDESLFVRLDARTPLPFAMNSVEWVYAEHMIEHLSLMDGIRWTRELKRILVPGGLLRLTTPDLGKYMACYMNDDGFFTRHRERFTEKYMADRMNGDRLSVRHRDRLMDQGIPLPSRRAFMVNQIFRFYGHRWIYDLEELYYLFDKAGFSEDSVTVCSFREGSVREISDLDREWRREETIYVEALA